MGMAVGLAGSPAGVKTFGEEKLVYYREAAAGHNRVAYYFGKVSLFINYFLLKFTKLILFFLFIKMVSMYYREILAALHFTMIYHILAQPLIQFHRLFAIILLFFFAVYGLAAVVSFLVKRENASLLAVVIGLFAGVFNGFGPNLADARDWVFIYSFNIFYFKYILNYKYSFWLVLNINELIVGNDMVLGYLLWKMVK